LQGRDENDGTMMIHAQELLTERDCEQIIRCDGCSVGYAWPPAERPSRTMVKHIRDFAGAVRLAALVYGNLSPEEQRWMCDGLLDITGEMANEGYLTKYGVYVTDDEKRGCVVAFWPVHVDHNGEFRVLRLFDDLFPKTSAGGNAGDPEAA